MPHKETTFRQQVAPVPKRGVANLLVLVGVVVVVLLLLGRQVEHRLDVVDALLQGDDVLLAAGHVQQRLDGRLVVVVAVALLAVVDVVVDDDAVGRRLAGRRRGGHLL